MALRIHLLLGLILCALARNACAQRTCAEIIEGGGPMPDETNCRAFPGECAVSEENIEACAASGGTCFDDSFCCPEGWELCGAGFATISACYDPSFHTCCGLFSAPGGTAPVLCDSPAREDRTNACMQPSRPGCAPLTPPSPEEQGDQCRGEPFDPQTHVCIQGFVLCPRSAWLPCGVSCFNPNNYACEGELVFDQTRVGSGGMSTLISTNWALCPSAAPLRCGEAGCFSPEQYVCHTNNRADLVEDVLCPVDFPLLCGANACYNSAQYTCVDGQLQQAA